MGFGPFREVQMWAAGPAQFHLGEENQRSVALPPSSTNATTATCNFCISIAIQKLLLFGLCTVSKSPKLLAKAASRMAHVSFASTAGSSYFYHHHIKTSSNFLSFTCHVTSQIRRDALFSSVLRSNAGFRCRYWNSRTFPSISCSAANKPSSPTDISSTAKLRSEVLSPFRSVRMFFYLAFIASGGLGGLIALTRLIAALTNPARSAEVPEMLQGLGIDIAAVSVFAFLYYRENSAKQAQIARLSREENLSNLKLRVNDKRIIPVSSLRGVARLVICAGPESYILESCRLSEPFTQSLLDRGVLVVPFATDGSSPTFDFDEGEETEDDTSKRKRLWQLSPTIISDWSKWLDEQKKLAGVPPESPVYISLRLDGRVRGSGVGYPPWNALVAQLPPIKGMWSGLFDGFDGRV